MDDGSNEFELDPALPNGPDEEANKKAAETELQRYSAALEQEWTDGVKYDEGTLTPLEIRSKSKELLTQAVPKAIASMLYLAQHAGNENTRLKAAQFIIDKAIGREIGGMVGDPMEELLQGLRSKDNSAA